MAEYINRQAFLDHMKGTSRYFTVKFDIESFPVADVAPVVHGRWEYTPQTFNTLGQIRCPFCAWWSLDPSIDGIYNYCPNCGARMDGGDSNASL